MSIENEGGRPHRELTPQQRNSPEQAGFPKGNPADSPLAPILRERHGGEERSHAELVEAFRHAIQHEHQALGELAKYHSPVEIIDAAFSKQVQYIISDDKADKQRGAYFGQILAVWNVIAFEHYGEGSLNSGDLDRHYAALNLDAQYNRAKAQKASRPEIITLDDPLQVRIIDAAAEATGIPHQRGQTTFEIPEKFWDYRAQVHQANEERRRQGG